LARSSCHAWRQSRPWRGRHAVWRVRGAAEETRLKQLESRERLSRSAMAGRKMPLAQGSRHRRGILRPDSITRSRQGAALRGRAKRSFQGERNRLGDGEWPPSRAWFGGLLRRSKGGNRAVASNRTADGG